MTDIRNDQIWDPWDCQGNEEMQFLFLLVSALMFFYQKSKYTSKERKTKNRLK